MRAKEILSAALVAAAAAVAASPAAAQPGTPAAPSARVVATYDVQSSGRSRGFPARVTVADSAGVLVGSLHLVGDDVARPLDVSVAGSDLVLRGESPRGAVEFVLFRGNARPDARGLSGRWTIGASQGALRGAHRG